MEAVAGEHITFTYGYDAARPALDDVSFAIPRGTLTAVLGRNGCGKSTLAKHLNALLPLQQGELTVAGIDVRDEARRWELRRRCGMVFQNPDKQFVSSLVAEDVAFGLQNYGVPKAEQPGRIADALARVGMSGCEQRSPHLLSGGQKQRVALAGVLALNPEIIILDEVTAMLDPEGRREVLAVIDRLRQDGRTIVMITHYVEEAVAADQLLLMADGRIIASGAPRELLTDSAALKSAGLLPPLAARAYNDLRARGIKLSRCPLTSQELAEEICRLS